MIRALLLTLSLGFVTLGAQAEAPTSAVIVLQGAPAKTLSLTPELLKTFARHTREVNDHGTPARFEGVSLADVLAHAGVPPGGRLRGADMNLVLEVTAADGYRAAFAVAELDPGTGNRFVLLADRRDGKPLPEAEGPYRLVVPDDRRAARWVRQVTGLQLTRPQSAADSTGAPQ